MIFTYQTDPVEVQIPASNIVNSMFTTYRYLLLHRLNTQSKPVTVASPIPNCPPMERCPPNGEELGKFGTVKSD